MFGISTKFSTITLKVAKALPGDADSETLSQWLNQCSQVLFSYVLVLGFPRCQQTRFLVAVPGDALLLGQRSRPRLIKNKIKKWSENMKMHTGKPSIARAAAGSNDEVAAMVATQQIEYLRKRYASATDLIGSNEPENMAAGRQIYREIFTPDVTISASGDAESAAFAAVGPDAWVDVAADALRVFDATQHLIGTQLVTIESLPNDAGEGGEATMTSYLQAWHSDTGRVLDIFIGTYHDKVRFVPGKGWQIYDMVLEKISGEVTSKSAPEDTPKGG